MLFGYMCNICEKAFQNEGDYCIMHICAGKEAEKC